MALPQSVLTRSFAGGELAPALALRADLAKYTIGVRTCRNFIVRRAGGLANRPGTIDVGACKTDDIDVRLIRYEHETIGQSVLIEHGEGYFRFWLNGAQVGIDAGPAYDAETAYTYGDIVSSGGVNYYCLAPTTGNDPPDDDFWYAMPDGVLELPSPFSDPRGTKVVQSGRTLAFTHPSVRPHDLIYVSVTQWILVPVDTTPQVAAPQDLTVDSGTGGSRSYGYVVTAAHPVTYEESLPSAQVINAAAAEPTADAPHALSWTAVLTPPTTGTASPEYYVYCDPYGNGTYGYIGTATGAAAFNNPGLTPDFTRTPQIAADLFNAEGEYPSVCGFHDQRRFFAHTDNLPDAVYGSKVGLPNNFLVSSPLQDDDAISFRIAGNNLHPVQQLVDLKQLLVLTGGGEWAIGAPQTPLTPSAIPADQQTYVGMADIPAVVIGNSLLYVQAREKILRELRFDQEVESFAGRDLTVYATHLLEGRTFARLDFQQVPDSIVWCVLSDGALLGLTYLHDQDIWGWHRHDTSGGTFEDVCVIPEAEGDVAYFVVKRGTSRRIERLASREIVDWNADSLFVDAALSYSGDPVRAVSGLDHLEGKTVRVIADGVDLGTATVSAGGVTLPGSASGSEIHVGLGITQEFETLDLDVAGSSIRDQKKRIGSVVVEVEASDRHLSVGPDSDHLRVYAPRTTEAPSTVSYTGPVELSVFGRFVSEAGRLFVRHEAGLPLTVLGLIPRVELGG